MRTPDQKEAVDTSLTQASKERARRTLEREGEALELRVEELEERIAPRLASNHNETFLVDR